MYFLVCKGLLLGLLVLLSNDDVGGGQRAPYFRRYLRELVSKPAISLQECWGGYRRTTGLTGSELPQPPQEPAS